VTRKSYVRPMANSQTNEIPFGCGVCLLGIADLKVRGESLARLSIDARLIAHKVERSNGEKHSAKRVKSSCSAYG